MRKRSGCCCGCFVKLATSGKVHTPFSRRYSPDSVSMLTKSISRHLQFFFFLAVSPASIVTKCSVIHLSESHRDSDLSCRRLPDCHLTKHFENNGVFRNRQCGNKDQAEGKIKRRGVGEKQQQFNFCAEQ